MNQADMEREADREQNEDMNTEPHHISMNPLQMFDAPVSRSVPSGDGLAFWETSAMDEGADIGSLGEPPDDARTRMETQLKVELERWALWEIDNAGAILGGSEEEIAPPSFLDQQDHQMDDALPVFATHNEEDASQWKPYPSKLMFLLDMMDNLPRLRISSSIMKLILWLLRASGVENVPSYKMLRKTQTEIRDETGVLTIHRKTPKGKAFSFNDPRALVGNDWSNPITSPQIRMYPVIPRDGVISEIWHASKWRQELDRHLLSPMYAEGNTHYYIDEPALLKDGRMVVPVRWLENKADGKIMFEAWAVEFDDNVSILSYDICQILT
ncbi:hypothetical protein Agabi119p4_7676 [Agaricus bisporus var. burnettii]|uniref:Uncharacterized protein n=1 Tax=Agaricus bisporus var. burnettii TaxID=192524 RepID=A0A8H7C8J5_AGABI|nr:hypothetical protein Agabi119p4_7676 [Agaricus bisporus var. burnettii]